MTSGEPGRRRVLGTLVFGLSLLVIAASLLRNEPIGNRFFGDEWFTLGVNLRVNGTVGIGREPIVFRPPGYPVFEAAVLGALPKPSLHETSNTFPWSSDLAPLVMNADPSYLERGARLVYLAQGVVLSLTAALLFSWMSRFLPLEIAFCGAALFGMNAYTVILAGQIFYGALNLFFLVGAFVWIDWALAFENVRWRRWVGAGLFVGIGTLVRPVTLLLPPFLLIALLLRFPLRGAVKAFVVFVASMWLVIVPWTLRNRAVCGRLVPVNAQGWILFYAATAQRHPADPGFYNWGAVLPQVREVAARITGDPLMTYTTLVRHNLELEDGYRAAALENLRREPTVYLHNVAACAKTLLLDMDRMRISIYRLVQTPSAKPRDWGPALRETGATRAFAAFAGALGILAAAGLMWGLVRRERAFLAPLVVLLPSALSHVLTWMDVNYYFFKWPFLFAFAFAAIGWLPRTASRVVAGLVVAWGALFTALVLR